MCSKYKHVCPEGAMLLASGDMPNLKLKSLLITAQKLAKTVGKMCAAYSVARNICRWLTVMFFFNTLN
jgi:hypothetical protein